MKLEEVENLLRSYRIPFGTERAMQDEIERIFDAATVPFVREAQTGTGPIDFLVGGVGVECKVGGSPASVIGQLLRYSESESIDSLILVTSRRAHSWGVEKLGGKLFRVVWVAGNF